MIKMKKFIRSLVVALGGIFIAATASEAAGISFHGYPDDNNIIHYQARPNTDVPLTIIIDTSLSNLEPYLLNRLVTIFLEVRVNDGREVLLVNPPIYSPLHLPQNQRNNLNLIVSTLYPMVDEDGGVDLSLRLIDAFIGQDGFYGYKNLKSEFGSVAYPGSNDFISAIDFEPQYTTSAPEPSTMLAAAVALGWGAWLKRKNSSQ